MERYEPRIEDGVLYIEGTDGGWVEVGAVSDIIELVGGETYELQYGDYGNTADWVDTDEQGVLSFDVRETITEMDHREDFVRALEGADLEETNDAGYPLRTALFADLMTRIWDSKGNIDIDL